MMPHDIVLLFNGNQIGTNPSLKNRTFPFLPENSPLLAELFPLNISIIKSS